MKKVCSESWQACRRGSNLSIRVWLVGERAGEALREVDESVIPWFADAAKQLLDEYQDPQQALARALAKITGQTELRVSPRPVSSSSTTNVSYLVPCWCCELCALVQGRHIVNPTSLHGNPVHGNYT